MQTHTSEYKEVSPTDSRFNKVLKVRNITNDTFAVRFTKPNFGFKAGQHISLGIRGDFQSREYSIYSSEQEDFMEVLVKEVQDGYFSPKLKKLKQGKELEVNGPFGNFGIEKATSNQYHHVFIASGSGIAPYRSMVKSNPGLDFELIHGVRFRNDRYELENYSDAKKITVCTSRDEKGDFVGRLTEYLKQADFPANSYFYLCGNSAMIFDALEILEDKGFSREQMHCEVYF